MKFTTRLFWVLLSPIALASPLQVDVNVHLDVDDTLVQTSNVKSTPICQLAATTSSKPLPTVELGYEIHRASPDKEVSDCIVTLSIS